MFISSRKISSLRNKNIIIFDLDGTLYKFRAGSYQDSLLSERVQSRKEEFFGEELGEENVEEILSYIREKYGEDTSLAVEKEFGVDRYDYFDFVWDIDPEGIIVPSESLDDVMDLSYRKAILTNAPGVWAYRVLDELGVSEKFETVQTGEKDERKPLKSAYRNLLDELEAEPKECVMVGDQKEHDIIPAYELGMTTVYIDGKSDKADYEVNSLKEVLDIL